MLPHSTARAAAGCLDLLATLCGKLIFYFLQAGSMIAVILSIFNGDLIQVDMCLYMWTGSVLFKSNGIIMN